ncbi:hypothetical protein ACOMHN_034789 [Nucella lapillus]
MKGGGGGQWEGVGGQWEGVGGQWEGMGGLWEGIEREIRRDACRRTSRFRPKRSTVGKIFNIKILIKKHLKHQRDLFHNFIDFKKAFDQVWHDGLWQVMRNYNIDSNIIDVIKALYDDSKSAVLLNNHIGELFRTTVGVRQGCLLSPVLFNIYLENIMTEALSGFQPSIYINGCPISNLRFTDDIDLTAGTERELQDLTTRLETRSKAFGMEVSDEKSKTLLNSTSNSAELDTQCRYLEHKYYRKLLRIHYSEHKTNEYARQRIDTLADKQEPLLSVVKCRKLTWFGHVNRHDSLDKTILQGTIEGGCQRSRQRKAWADNAKEWTGETYEYQRIETDGEP